jgi:integrase
LAERTNSLIDAIREAENLNAELDSWRAGLVPAVVKAGTLPWLVKLYRADGAYTDLRAKTQTGYDQCIREIEAWSERAGHPPLSSIERRHVKEFIRQMVATPFKAAAIHRVLRILMRFAVDEGYIATNPAEKIRLKGCASRTVVWTPQEIIKFCDAARAEGRSSLALAALLAADLGQREGDLLRLTWNQYNGQTISLRQSKTGAYVAVPVSGELKSELDKAPRRSPNILVNETTERPYKGFNFGHLFRKIARKAEIGDHLRFMDLRRTSAVELAEAGCEIHEISAITGHGLTRSHDIMEVYVPRNRAMARNAVDKRNEHRKRTKLEV